MDDTWYTFFWAAAISLANFQSGYSLNQIHQVWNMTPWIYDFEPEHRNTVNTWAVTILPLVAAIIAPFTWWLSWKFGKRRILIWTSVIVIIASGLKMIKSLAFLFIGRGVMGISTGVTSVLWPMFIYDITPIKWRGVFIGFMQVMINIGWVVGLSVGLSIPAFETDGIDHVDYWGDYHLGTNWRLVYIIPAFPAALHIILMLFLFKSELEYIKPNEGAPLLERNTNPQDGAQPNLRAVARSGASSGSNVTRRVVFVESVKLGPYFKIFKKENIRSISAGWFIHFLHQIAGINMILQYSFYFPIEIKINQMNWRFVMGWLLVFISILSLVLVHFLKRKPILLVGSLICWACHVLLFQLYEQEEDHTTRDFSEIPTILTLIVITLFIIGYGSTIGTTAWVYSAEILTEQGMGLAVWVHWAANFLIFWLRNFAIFIDPTHKPDHDLDKHTVFFFFIYSTIWLISYFIIVVFYKRVRRKDKRGD